MICSVFPKDPYFGILDLCHPDAKVIISAQITNCPLIHEMSKIDFQEGPKGSHFGFFLKLYIFLFTKVIAFLSV